MDGEAEPCARRSRQSVKAAGGGEWQGEIYNRENAKTYSCKISLSTPDQLTVRPYVGLPLFGKTLRWTRVATERAPN